MPKLVASKSPFVKIMTNNSDDPFTTPNGNHDKFLFNSENQKVGYIKDIFAVEPDFVTYPVAGGTTSNPSRYYYPPGSNKNTSQITIFSYSAGGFNRQQWMIFPSYFMSVYGFPWMPLVEMRPCLDIATSKFRGPYIDISGNGVSNGQIYSFIGATSRTFRLLDSGSAIGIPNRAGILIGNPWVLTASASDTANYRRVLITVFDLPMHDEAIPNNATTPVSGQEVIRLDHATPGKFRIALPGKTVGDSDPNNYILHEDRIPAKVLASGIVTVPANGTVTITTRLPMTPLTYMDFLTKKSSESTFWHPAFIGSFSANANDFTYTISGKNLTIVSTCGVSMDIIYAIFADSGDDYTTGGSQILLKGNDGIGDYIQVKRPGSSDVSPGLNDIMLDTRLKYLPLLAEGFLNWSSDFPTVISGSDLFKGVRKTNLTIPNPDGLLLFPKIGAIYNPPSSNSISQEASAVWGEHAVFVNNATWQGRATGWSTWFNALSSTSVDIFASNNNPDTIQPTASFWNSQLKGVRYYIFGIKG